jgi:hypothetical protein
LHAELLQLFQRLVVPKAFMAPGKQQMANQVQLQIRLGKHYLLFSMAQQQINMVGINGLSNANK